mgnify:FL=1|jgi:hypothetical protein
MKKHIEKLKLHTIDVVNEWTSKKWHKSHRWHSGTGKFLKRMLNKKIRHEKW